MRKKNKTAPVEIQARVRLEAKPDTPFYYVNYMAVSHSDFDFTISVTRISTSFTPEQLECAQKGEPVPFEATLQLVVPPMVITGLIKALTEQLQKYEEKVRKKGQNGQQ